MLESDLITCIRLSKILYSTDSTFLHFGLNPESKSEDSLSYDLKQKTLGPCRKLIAQKERLILNGMYNADCDFKFEKKWYQNPKSVIKDFEEIQMYLNSRIQYNERTFGEAATSLLEQSIYDLAELFARYRKINKWSYIEIHNFELLAANPLRKDTFLGYISKLYNEEAEPLIEYESVIYANLLKFTKNNIFELVSKFIRVDNPIMVLAN